MNERNKPGGNGFLLGMLIGGALTLLFTTKRGRKILRELADLGLDALENLSELKNLEEVYEEEAETTNPEMGERSEKPDNGDSKVKRFFKGIKKK